jgi:hypothetical protein
MKENGIRPVARMAAPAVDRKAGQLPGARPR